MSIILRITDTALKKEVEMVQNILKGCEICFQGMWCYIIYSFKNHAS